MKRIRNITLTESDGTPIVDNSEDTILSNGEKPILTTEYLIKRMIDISQYENRTDQRLAEKIHEKILVINDKKSGENVILIEDAEHALLIKLKDILPILLKGTSCKEFHSVMENAEDVSPSELCKKKDS